MVFLLFIRFTSSETVSFFLSDTCASVLFTFVFLVAILSYFYFLRFSHSELQFNVFYVLFSLWKVFHDCIINSHNIFYNFLVSHFLLSYCQLYAWFFNP